MSEQVLDVRSTLSVLRRHRWTLALAAVLGLVAGIGFVYLRPPLYTSQSLVLLPASQSADGQRTGVQDAQTQARIAGSEVVLGPAGKSLSPAVSARRLAKSVKVTTASGNVVQITASSSVGVRAEQIARAVARADLDYIHKASSSLSSAQRAALEQRQKTLGNSLATVNAEIERTKARIAGEGRGTVQGRADAAALAQLTAQQGSLTLQIDQVKSQRDSSEITTGTTVIEDATPAERPNMIVSYAVAGLAGLALVSGLVTILLVAFGRRDRRLRYRDEIADALGGVVIASARSQAPRSVAGWSALMGEYEPGTVDAWALRQALRHLLGSETAIGSSGASGDDADEEPTTVTLIALSDDVRGLALGPQLASYAASAGIRTRLVAAQGHPSAAALWAACSGVYENAEIREKLTIGTQVGIGRADLELVLAVVDRRSPQLGNLPRGGDTVLVLSSGSATAEDLARAAVTADDSGRRIEGIVVADPDDLDRTTGRLLQSERAQQVPLPAHLTGAADAPGATVSGLRSRRLR